MTFAPWTGPGKNPMTYTNEDIREMRDMFRGRLGEAEKILQEQPIMMGTLGGGGGEKNPLGTAGPGGDLQRIQRLQGIQFPQMQNRGPQNLQGQLQRMFGGGIFGGQRPTNQGPVGGRKEQTDFVLPPQQMPELRIVNPYGQGGSLYRGGQGRQEITGYSPFPPQGGYNRGINPGGMYTGGQGGGFGSPFGGSMRGGRQQPQYGGGMGGGYGGGYGGGGFPGYGGGMGGGYGMPSPPNMGYGNRFPGMQFSGPFAQPMMPQNYGMGGGFGGGYPMPQPRYPMPQPRMPYPMMGGGYGGGMGGGYGGGYGGGFGDMIQMFGGY